MKGFTVSVISLIALSYFLLWVFPKSESHLPKQTNYKVLLHEGELDFESTPSSECLKSQTSRPFDKCLKPGSSFALLIDEICQRGMHVSRQKRIALEGAVLRPQSPLRPLKLKSYKYLLESPRTLQSLYQQAEKWPCLKVMSHNQKVYTTEVPADSPTDGPTNDPMLFQQTHAQAIGWQDSYKVLFSNIKKRKPIKIAIIDTGIELTHPDLQYSLWINEAEKDGQGGVDDDGNGYVDDIYGYNISSDIGDPSHQTVNDHGTHVAGLLGATSNNTIGGAGVMGQQVELMVLNVFGKNWGSETVDIDRGIIYAIENQADIINISLGGPGHSETTAELIRQAVARGILVVAAAGNLAEDISQRFYFPASYAKEIQGMISVAALDVSQEGLCANSNYSDSVVEIAAPGCDSQAKKQGLFSTRSRGRYGYKKGTSMAAPLVSGALAHILSLHRGHAVDLTPAEAEAFLLENSPSSAALSRFVRGGRILDLKELSAGWLAQ